jgi:cytidyltransferase-like protein
MRKIAVYPGRFHPFHKGHASSFQQLANEFGKNNTYLAISQKQEQPKSPFSASDRAKMAMVLGIPKENIVSVANTYGGEEYIKRFKAAGIDPENTILVLAVSGKDMDGTDARFSFKPKKDGSLSYLQPYTNGSLEPMTKHAYIMTTEVGDFDIAGQTVRDASTIRNMYMNADDKGKIKVLQDLYGAKGPQLLKNIFDTNLISQKEKVSESIQTFIKNIKPLMESANTEQKVKIFNLLNQAKTILNQEKNVENNTDYLPEK